LTACRFDGIILLEESPMSIVRTEVTLKNAVDVVNVSNGILQNHEIRQTTLQAMVDTGAWTLVINEAIRNTLGLQILGSDYGTLADGKEEIYNVAGPLEVIWKDRRTICVALVLPTADEVLLGAIPLEALDLTINPRKEEVIGAHGDQPLHSVK
jgi:clan AA aspartic protease